MSALILDIETSPLPGFEQYLDPVEASRNLKDPEKIKADLEKKAAAQQNDCGLDWNLCRIVALGKLKPDAFGPHVDLCRDEVEEAASLLAFADLVRGYRNSGIRLLGFRIRTFDMPVLMQRARYLSVPFPPISLKRWDNPHLIDLYDMLTFDEAPCTAVMKRSLSSFCRRFGLDVPEDATTGADIAALVAAEDWAGVEAHCRADLLKTAALARRLGVIQPQPVESF